MLPLWPLFFFFFFFLQYGAAIVYLPKWLNDELHKLKNLNVCSKGAETNCLFLMNAGSSGNPIPVGPEYVHKIMKQ